MEKLAHLFMIGVNHLFNTMDQRLGWLGILLLLLAAGAVVVAGFTAGTSLSVSLLDPKNPRTMSRRGASLLLACALGLGLGGPLLRGFLDASAAKAWIATSGDERLKLLVDEGLLLRDGNFGLYAQERISHDFKGWVPLPESGLDMRSPTWPTLPQFCLLKAARASTDQPVDMAFLIHAHNCGWTEVGASFSQPYGNFPVVGVPSLGCSMAYDPSGWLAKRLQEAPKECKQGH